MAKPYVSFIINVSVSHQAAPSFCQQGTVPPPSSPFTLINSLLYLRSTSIYSTASGESKKIWKDSRVPSKNSVYQNSTESRIMIKTDIRLSEKQSFTPGKGWVAFMERLVLCYARHHHLSAAIASFFALTHTSERMYSHCTVDQSWFQSWTWTLLSISSRSMFIFFMNLNLNGLQSFQMNLNLNVNVIVEGWKTM